MLPGPRGASRLLRRAPSLVQAEYLRSWLHQYPESNHPRGSLCAMQGNHVQACQGPDTRLGPSPSMMMLGLLYLLWTMSPHPYFLSLVGTSQKQGPQLMVSICHTGPQSPPVPVSTKTLQNPRDLEKMGCCACRGWTLISQILPAHLLMIPILD